MPDTVDILGMVQTQRAADFKSAVTDTLNSKAIDALNQMKQSFSQTVFSEVEPEVPDEDIDIPEDEIDAEIDAVDTTEDDSETEETEEE